MKKRAVGTLGAAVVAVCAGVITSAHADTFTWANNGLAFASATSWITSSSHSVPGAGDQAIFNYNYASGSVPNVSAVGPINIGSIVVTGQGKIGWLDIPQNNQDQLTMTDSASFTIGSVNHDNALFAFDAGFWQAQNMVLGDAAGATGTLQTLVPIYTGVNLPVGTILGNAVIGQSGNGVVQMFDGQTTVDGDTRIAANSGSTGSLQLNRYDVLTKWVTNNLYVGGSGGSTLGGGTGNVQVGQGSTISVTTSAYVHAGSYINTAGFFSAGNITVEGGTSPASFISSGSTSTTTFSTSGATTISGGTLSASTFASTGITNISGGVLSAGTYQNESGILNLQSGTLRTGSYVPSGTASLNWTGGNVELTGNYAVPASGIFPNTITAGFGLFVDGTLSDSSPSTGLIVTNGGIAGSGDANITGYLFAYNDTAHLSAVTSYNSSGNVTVGGTNSAFEVLNGATSSIAKALTLNSGALLDLQGGSITVHDFTQNTGSTVELYNGTFTVAGGAFTPLAAAGEFTLDSDKAADSINLVLQNGTGSTPTLYVGENYNAQLLANTNEQLTTTGNALVGATYDSVGSVTLSDASTLWHITGRLDVGANAVNGVTPGSGTVTVNTGATLTVDQVINVNDDGHLIINGGTVNVAALFMNKGSGLNFSSGILNITSGDAIIDSGPVSTLGASVKLVAGETIGTSGLLIVGKAGTGSLQLQTQASDTKPAAVSFTFGYIGIDPYVPTDAPTGSFLLQGPKSSASGASLAVGDAVASSSGLLNVSGGSLVLTGALSIGDNGTVIFNGGSISAAGLSKTAAGTFNWMAGSLIDTGSMTLAAGQLFPGNLSLGSTQSLTIGQTLSVGTSGQQYLSLAAGASLVTSALVIGAGPAGQGNVTLVGANLNLSSTSLTMGLNGISGSPSQGNLLMLSGSTVQIANASLGANANGQAFITLLGNGTTLEDTQPMSLGGLGTASVTLDTGTTLKADAGLSLLQNSTLFLSGGTANAASLVTTGNGALNWTSGTLNLTAAVASLGSTMNLIVPTAGTFTAHELDLGTSGNSSGVLLENHGNTTIGALVGNSATVRLSQGQMTVGSFALASTGSFDWQGGTLAYTGNLNFPDSVLGTNLDLTAGHSLSVAGTTYLGDGTHDASITVDNAAFIAGTNGSISGITIENTNPAHAGLIVQNGGNVSSQFVYLGYPNAGTSGSILVTGNKSQLNLNGGVAEGGVGNVTGSGNITISNGATFTFTTIYQMQGPMLFTGPGTTVHGSVIYIGGSTLPANTGLTISNGASVLLDAGIETSYPKSVSIAPGSTLVAGTLTAYLAADPTFDNNGTLRVTDQLQGSLLNSGIFGSAVDSAANVDVTGSITELPGSELDVDINSSIFMPMEIDGVLTAAGTLDVSHTYTTDTFSAGASFQVFDLTTPILGQFDTLELPPLDPGLAWNSEQLYSHGILSVSAVPEPASLSILPLASLLLRRRKSRGKTL